MSWDMISKFVSRRVAALLLGLYFVDRVANASPYIMVAAMAGMTVVFIISQTIEDCVLKIKPPDESSQQKPGN